MITDVRVQVLDPAPVAIVAPRFSISSVHNVLVEMDDDSGTTGIAYGYVFDPYAAAAVEQLLVGFGAAYVGEVADDVRQIHDHLLVKKVNFLGMRGMARLAASVLDMAAWDLLCRLRSTNLMGLFGCHSDSIPTFTASGLWAGIEPEECARIAVEVAEDFGTPFAKIWVNSHDFGFEYERVAAVKEALGPEGGVIVDAAQAYDWRTVAKLADRLAPLEPLWFEDPVSYEDLPGLEAFARDAPMDVGVGEHMYGIDHLKQHLDMGVLAHMVLDLERIGGITDYLAAATLCEAYGVGLASHCYPHVAAQVLATSPAASWCELAPLWDGLFGRSDVHDGRIHVALERVGTGLDLLPGVVAAAASASA